ncbi:MAG TPA: M3 family oligoendopeptidase [Cytophagales bacterium]|nr:M3 family oligoendopeptidase [Cytophagales bacterium]HAA22547.1 M3 family oligoendopeptidase [Cytophagales bacterium]HAP60924.1 M3 family oligoendopeptidase [Cytophagales bacterium]
MSTTPAKLERPARRYLSEDFSVTTWEALEPFFQELEGRELPDADALRRWFQDRSELESVLSEDMAWRYIRMTTDTADEEATARYNEFVQQISPNMAPYGDRLNRKGLDHPNLEEIKAEGYAIMLRGMRKDVEIFREENIPLQTEIQTETQKYGQLTGAMTVEHDGQELTLQQAGVLLQRTDRALREEVYHKIQGRRIQDKEPLDELYNKLIGLRHQVAQNAGFTNFRDYMFTAMGRFDYTPEDAFAFHEAIAEEVVPLFSDLMNMRKEALDLDSLRPWDKAVDPSGKPPLKPFEGGEDLLTKTTTVFRKLNPYLGERLEIMRNMEHLDLVSRKGKSPGGYNYPLMEIGVPFIFMNATSTVRDMVTLLHEGGHAVHSFLVRELELVDFKSTPSEVAELASMSMELLTMDYWDEYFADEEELRRAKRNHLEDLIFTLPWVATIDQFQHWIYENPDHTVEERLENWNRIFDRFADQATDWSDLQEHKDYLWQKQLHLYQVPFYYIEYGFAQLGAVAVWKNYKENPEKGLQGYLDALKLGYTKSIPEVYAAAGIKFDFSREYIRELMQFVRQELAKL